MPLTSIENLSLGKENVRSKKELVGKAGKNKEVEEKVEKKEEVEEPLLKENPRRCSDKSVFESDIAYFQVCPDADSISRYLADVQESPGQLLDRRRGAQLFLIVRKTPNVSLSPNIIICFCLIQFCFCLFPKDIHWLQMK